MRTRLVLVVSLCMSTALWAQSGTRNEPTWLLRVNPCGLIDLYGPQSVQVGVEHAFSSHLSLALEAGYYFQYRTALTDAPDESFSGQGIRLQAIRWSERSGGDMGLGFDVAYKYTAGTCRDSIKPDSAVAYSKDYGLTRSVFMVRGYGIKRVDWGEHLRVEVLYGLGVRFKFARSTGISSKESDDINNRDEYGDQSMIPGLIHNIGDWWYPDIALGVRICYILK